MGKEAQKALDRDISGAAMAMNQLHVCATGAGTWSWLGRGGYREFSFGELNECRNKRVRGRN